MRDFWLAKGAGGGGGGDLRACERCGLREADERGLGYWLGQLTSGAETRYEALIGFSESAENKALFSEMTGLY